MSHNPICGNYSGIAIGSYALGPGYRDSNIKTYSKIKNYCIDERNIIIDTERGDNREFNGLLSGHIILKSKRGVLIVTDSEEISLNDVIKTVNELKKENEELKKQIKEIHTALYYRPDEMGAKDAEKHFESVNNDEKEID